MIQRCNAPHEQIMTARQTRDEGIPAEAKVWSVVWIIPQKDRQTVLIRSERYLQA